MTLREEKGVTWPEYGQSAGAGAGKRTHGSVPYLISAPQSLFCVPPTCTVTNWELQAAWSFVIAATGNVFKGLLTEQEILFQGQSFSDLFF